MAHHRKHCHSAGNSLFVLADQVGVGVFVGFVDQHAKGEPLSSDPITVKVDPKDLIQAAFDKWLKRLGLLWWEIDINFYDDPGEIVKHFRDPGEDYTVAAVTYVKWIYASASIDVNLPAFTGLDQDKIERIVVHECCHVLVNEMRECELHHEERVVTQLTKAFFWTETGTLEERDGNKL
jgi:hypothetical protein